MATITFEQIIAARAPNYVGDTRLTTLKALAIEFLAVFVPEGTPSEYAEALQVLHWLTLSDRAGNGGPDASASAGSISMEKEGELQVKYNAPAAGVMQNISDMKAEYQQTPWGLELYAFLRRYLVTVMTRFV